MIVSYSREERVKQIESAMAVRVVGSKPPASMRQIAKALGMRPSKHVMNMLWDMVDAGKLIANPRNHRPGWIAWDFQIAPHRVNLVVGQAYEVQK